MQSFCLYFSIFKIIERKALYLHNNFPFGFFLFFSAKTLLPFKDILDSVCICRHGNLGKGKVWGLLLKDSCLIKGMTHSRPRMALMIRKPLFPEERCSGTEPTASPAGYLVVWPALPPPVLYVMPDIIPTSHSSASTLCNPWVWACNPWALESVTGADEISPELQCNGLHLRPYRGRSQVI